VSVLSLPSRIEAATPAGRDRAVDALRALAILGVVLGHWLVTAFVAADGELRVASPLSSQPLFIPVSWLLQTLAVFFLVGGYAAARSLASAPGYRFWLRARLVRLVRPILVLLGFWAVAASTLDSLGLSDLSMHSLRSIVLSPLWFIAVYAVLTALTPVVVAARRYHLAPALVGVVAMVDLVRFGLHGPGWLGWINLLAGWLVPYCLGVAWAAGARLRPAALLIGAAAATAVLVLWCGYPASMVGVPGDGRSNLSPPALAAVTFGLAQVGLALLLRGPLTRLARRPLAWTGVALVNLSAMTIFLWHQTALIAVTTFALGYGRLPGLHTPPVDVSWVLHRLVWLPVFALVLAGLVALAYRFERATTTSGARLRRRGEADGDGRAVEPAANRGGGTAART
jgi:peptidoglycan/LPS O-acetylase OafA/YrhL